MTEFEALVKDVIDSLLEAEQEVLVLERVLEETKGMVRKCLEPKT
jgi:hypothetical protein